MDRARTCDLLALLASLLVSGCQPSYRAQPFHGTWIDVPGIADVVPWSDVSEAPAGAPSLAFLYGMYTADGLLACRDIGLDGSSGHGTCSYYLREIAGAAGPKVKAVGDTLERVVAVHDLDGDGKEDWVTTSGAVLWGGWNGAMTHLPVSPNGPVAFFEPDNDGRLWVVATAGCDSLRLVSVMRQTQPGSRDFEDISATFPSTVPVNTNTPTAHCLPSGDCYMIALGFACGGGEGTTTVNEIFRRAAGGTAWEIFLPPDPNAFSSSAMGALWQDRPDGGSDLYVTENPQNLAFHVSTGKPWEPFDLPWTEVPGPVSGRSQTPWNYQAIEVDGLHAVCTGHGFDNPSTPSEFAIGSETVNCFAPSAGTDWVKLTDPTLNRTAGQPGVAANKQVWGQFRELDTRVDPDGITWLAANVLIGYGDRQPRFLVYDP